MPNRSNDKTRLLDAESVEAEFVDHENSVQPSAAPPSYEFATGSLSYQNQTPYNLGGISGQSSFGNYSAPAFNQPQPTLYYLQPVPAQSTSSNGISALPTNQPFYQIAASGGQPVLVNPYRTSQPRPGRTQPGNWRAPRTDPEPDSPDNTCSDCGLGVLFITTVGFICIFLAFSMP